MSRICRYYRFFISAANQATLHGLLSSVRAIMLQPGPHLFLGFSVSSVFIQTVIVLMQETIKPP